MDYRTLKDKDLVLHCLDNNREAWDEYFRRFNKLIYAAIKRTLTANGHEKLVYDQDILADIHLKIVTRHISNNILRQCDAPERVHSWLWRVVVTSTYDFLRARHYQINLPRTFEEDLMAHLDDFIGGNDDSTLGDIIGDVSIDLDLMRENKDTEKVLERVFENMNDIDSEKQFWALRLSYLAHDPLSDEEMVELSAFNKIPFEELKDRLIMIMRRLDERIEKKIRANAQAVILYYQILKYESRLEALGGKDKDLEEYVEHLGKRRQKCMHEGRMFCQPSHEDIAALIGIPEEKATQISNILKRVRGSLRSKRA